MPAIQPTQNTLYHRCKSLVYQCTLIGPAIQTVLSSHYFITQPLCSSGVGGGVLKNNTQRGRGHTKDNIRKKKLHKKQENDKEQ